MIDGTEGSRGIGHGKLKEQAAEKEKEWRKLHDLQIEALEASLNESRKELAEEKKRMVELKDNFKYNLRLIEERDAELHKYDTIFLELKSTILKKEHELSDCKIKIDELKTAAGKESKALEEMQLHYRQRLREKQAEIEQYRCDKDAEINAERDAIEAYKLSSDRRVVELEEELDKQRREMAMGFDEAMKKREHEHRVEFDKKNTTILAHELKVKMLANELAVLKAAQESSASELAQVDSFQRDIEKQLRQKEWELEDLKAMSTARNIELESKLQQCELAAKRNRDDFERRFAEADRVAREKEATLVKVRESANERESHLVAEIQGLSSKLEEASVRLRQLEWSVQDLETEKSNITTKLEEEILDIKLRWEANSAEILRVNVARDSELNALKDHESKLRTELEQSRHTVKRYKKDLASAIERQASLEQSKAQLELDWQQRCEDLERSQYARSEDLIQTLMKARDEALAQVHAAETKLQQSEEAMKLLTRERDQALATLSKHGLVADREIKVSSAEQSGEIVSLQKQNEELRSVIKQMRREMELLGDQMPTAVETQHNDSDAAMQGGAREVKQQGDRHQTTMLTRQPVDTSKSHPLPGKENNLSKDSVIISSHIQQLNDTIGAMRAEKMELMTQLRKQQLRIVHFENMVDQLSKQPREKQVEIDQLQYELNAGKRRTEAEVTSLRQRIADLELQVIEARKEADEYYRASVERNNEVTALANQLSQSKIDLAKSNPTINFGAQELLIQQLQDELNRVRRQLASVSDNWKQTNSVVSDPLENAVMTSGDVDHLRTQLIKAVRRVAQLSKEKQVLIELGNRLRAQLIHHGVKFASTSNRRQPVAEPPQSYRDEVSSLPQRSLLTQNFQNKMKELEQLQYDLTKQELAHKRRNRLRRGSTDESRNIQSSESDVDRPRSILKSHKPANNGSWSADEGPTQLRTSMSTMGGGDSLRDIWAMMDDEGGPSPQLTSRSPRLRGGTSARSPNRSGIPLEAASVARPRSADSLTVRGSRPTLQPKTTLKKSLSPKAAGKASPAAARKFKVRNYNLKDDLPSARR